MARRRNRSAKRKAQALVERQQLQTLPSSEFGVAFLPGTQNTYPRLTTAELLRAYNRMPWLRAVVDKVSKAVAGTQWRLYVKRDDNGRAVKSRHLQNSDLNIRGPLIKKGLMRGDLEEIEQHPFLDLLDAGNDRIIGSAVLQVTEQHIDIVGEAFWALEMNSFGVPEAIWPMPPDWVKEFPTQSNPYWKINLQGYEYNLPEEMMISFIDPDPADPYRRGSGIAASVSDELETDDYAARHIKSFFINRARPDLIISGEGLGRSDTARLEEKWNMQHRGFWNAFKPHFINRKIDIKEVGQSFKDMNLAELRKQERDIVLQVYAIPPEKMGILVNSNRSTIISSDMFWTKDVIMPRVDRIRHILQNQLIPFFDERLILDFESPVIEDSEHTLNVMKAMPAAFKVNEWREEADKPPLDDDVGEMHLLRPGEALVDEEDLEDMQPEQPALPAPSQPANDDDEEAQAMARKVTEIIANSLAKALG